MSVYDFLLGKKFAFDVDEADTTYTVESVDEPNDIITIAWIANEETCGLAEVIRYLTINKHPLLEELKAKFPEELI